MAVESTTGDRSSARMAAVLALLKAIHTVRTYPATNEMSRQALSHALPLLEKVLPLEIDPCTQGLRVAGEVLEEGERTRLMLPLFRDGVRRIELQPGLDAAEFERFVGALAPVLDPDDLSQDYVTRLWEADLPHVRVLAVDPYIVTDFGEAVLEGKDSSEAYADAPPDPTVEALPPPPEQAFRVNEADALRVAQEVEQADCVAPWGLFIRAVFSTLASEVGERRYDEVLALVETSYQRCLQAGRWRMAALLLEQLRAHADAAPTPALDAMRARMASSACFAPIHEALETGHCEQGELEALVVPLLPASIEPLLALLEATESDAASRIVVETLAGHAGAAAEAVLDRFETSRGRARMRLARIVGRLDHPEATSALVRALEDREDPGRPELVRALAHQTDREAAQALIRLALEDGDRTCRIVALRGLGGTSGRLGQGRLLERIRSRSFASLDDEEKDLLVLSLGKVGDDESIPLLQQMLKPAWLGLQTRPKEWRRAAQALAALGTREALEVLERGCDHRNAELAGICTEARRMARMRGA